MLDKSLNLCYYNTRKSEGEATRGKRAAPREAVRPPPKTSTARSPVARYISVDQTGVSRNREPLEAGRQDEATEPKGSFFCAFCIIHNNACKCV